MKNVLIGVALLFLMFIGFGLFGEKLPEQTPEQKRLQFARQDFDDCMAKFNGMSERDQYKSGIAAECMALRNKMEAMQLEANSKAGKK